MSKSCGECKFLSTQIVSDGLKPVCKHKVMKFKKRVRVYFFEDKDLTDNSCDKFIKYEEKAE